MGCHGLTNFKWDVLGQNVMTRTAAESTVSMNILYAIMPRIVSVMDPELAESEEEYNHLMTTIKRVFDYYATTLTLQAKILTQPTKRFSQHKMFLTLQERCQEFPIVYKDNTLIGFTLKDMAHVEFNQTVLRSHNLALQDYLTKLELKNPHSRYDKNPFYLLPECVARTLDEPQKTHFRKTDILQKSCHEAYLSACKHEGIQIQPKFQTTTKPINLEEKNVSNPV